MTFDRHWLALREPADGRARDPSLLLLARDAVEDGRSNIVLDVGCGTGSVYRALRPHLKRRVRWLMLDNAQDLLDAVETTGGDDVTLVNMDINDVAALPIAGSALVTAAALFDLCSAVFIQSFSRRVRESEAAIYAPLNYDGSMTWEDTHPLDSAVTDAFNLHQERDKGFGKALGHQAWSVVAETLQDQGYRIRTASSPWILAESDRDLHLRLLHGIAEAVEETDVFDSDDLNRWWQYRRASAQNGGESCRIGHRDVIAAL